MPCSYLPLLHLDRPLPTGAKRCSQFLFLSVTAVLVLCLLAFASRSTGSARFALIGDIGVEPAGHVHSLPISRGLATGVSDKSSGSRLFFKPSYPWTNSMLLWQRTSFHFQPEKNWMNDPDGPMYYKGWYHLFYQYNPDSAVWGNITWGHAVSKDLVHWLYLPIAMVPDHWYDANGVWTGSATLLPHGRLAMLYTGSTLESVQVQNLAFPADPDDQLLLDWVKAESNPVVVPPPGVGAKDFRDPTTAWYVAAEGAWFVAIGSKNDTLRRHSGIVLVYKTVDFIQYELLPGVLHAVDGTGMWECVDFFPVATEVATGLDTSEPAGPGVKHVLKASLDDDKHDYYAIGTYNAALNAWEPDEPEKDVGVGLRYDYGKFYASKTFFDPLKKRRVLWGWIGETDSERTDLTKGWASLQALPRTVLFDQKTGSSLLQWPVDEVDKLRLTKNNLGSISLAAGSVLPLDVGTATQLDIVAEFALNYSASANANEADVGYNCSTSGGAASRGVLGPFGFLVLADQNRSEQTAVYFYVARRTDGSFRTHFCQDELRSSVASDLVKRVYGSIVPVLDAETLTLRIVVDHSIVESFAQGGRTCITSRVYPTRAIYGAARLFLFNNATGVDVACKSLTVWQMNSAFIRPFDSRLDSSLDSPATKFEHDSVFSEFKNS
ncbi:beta-fructofuranosidase 1-like [Zingiber officinale]|uniref:beta-fructofuranosidase 1-like n=1 Tax=Zingiber officinale TaxID=94328 RepID=UPI001C4C0D7B|nr:beta-fructofuranosidase 1-like [Zingiber officinale]